AGGWLRRPIPWLASLPRRIGDLPQVVLSIVDVARALRFRTAEGCRLRDRVIEPVVLEARHPPLGVRSLDIAVPTVVLHALDPAVRIDDRDLVAHPVILEPGLEVERIDDFDVAIERVVDVLSHAA